MAEVLSLISFLIVHVLALLATSFPIVYLVFYTDLSAEGRSVVFFSIGFALLIDLELLLFYLTRATDLELLVQSINLVVVLYLLISTGYLLITLIRALRRSNLEP